MISHAGRWSRFRRSRRVRPLEILACVYVAREIGRGRLKRVPKVRQKWASRSPEKLSQAEQQFCLLVARGVVPADALDGIVRERGVNTHAMAAKWMKKRKIPGRDREVPDCPRSGIGEGPQTAKMPSLPARRMQRVLPSQRRGLPLAGRHPNDQGTGCDVPRRD